MKYQLEMWQGRKRCVVIGQFPTRRRAEIIVGLLDWSASWRPVIVSL